MLKKLLTYLLNYYICDQLTLTNLQLFPDSFNEELVAVLPCVYESQSLHLTAQACQYIF